MVKINNDMEFKCTCHNSGTNSFTGRCDRCGMQKPSKCTIFTNNSDYKTLHENAVNINLSVQPTLIQIINNLSEYALTLDRYNCESNSGGQDCWSTMEVNESGEYVKLKDVLNLFSAQKS